jgi:UPF0755 protein
MKSSKTVVNRFLVFLSVIIIAGIIGLLWWRDGISALDPLDTESVVFVVRKGDGVKGIVAKLAQQNLIRSPTAVFILIKLSGLERQLQAGDFRLTRSMDAATITKELTHGMLDVWVTILEGWRTEEIANKLTKELDIPESEFLKVAREGYMFPDTYLIPRDATAGAIMSLFLSNFNKKLDMQIRADLGKKNMILEDAITLASIVEREGRTDEDRPVIAGILINRLKSRWPLQADATLQYAIGYESNQKSWWKSGLSEEDKRIQSPFNTYSTTGLPPHPISNPGLASIRAVIYPKDTPYMFYLHDNSGTVHYAKTIEEHNQNIEKYLQ